MDGNEVTLLRLAIHDDAYIESVLALGLCSNCASGLDPRGQALARIGALVSADAPLSAYVGAIEAGLAAGTTRADLVGVLVALLPSVGAVRVAAAAPKLGLALGFDLDELLERLDLDPAKEDTMTDITEEQLEEIEALFVQSAAGLATGQDTVTLEAPSPSTLYFSDRPRREVGHISTRRFVELWDDGENSFAVDPPNAVLTFLGEEAAPPEDVVVMLLDPQLTAESLTYRVEVLEGELPGESGPVTLFIDSFGRPLTPVSAAGIHRRERRRMRRAR